jgi:8-oxo-dGTP diphosphatase
MWRQVDGDLEVLLVHRPKYDDWSWPKGKLGADESWPAAAVREVEEETGLRCVLGTPLPHAAYDIGADGGYRPKVVQYWAARPVGGDGDLAHEVDEVAWLTLQRAAQRLQYQRDHVQLRALARANDDGALDTWPLALLRHASAVPRRRWKDDDLRRPLDDAGRGRAAYLVDVLAAYRLTRVLSSDADRCTATVAPYVGSVGARLRGRHALSEEGFASGPTRSLRLLDKVARRAEPTLLCTHRPLLPSMLGWLAEHAATTGVAAALRESAVAGLVKGEALVAHMSGTGAEARVVAVERHDA